MNQLLSLLTLFSLLFLVSHLTAYFWRSIFRGKKYSLIVFPGVVIHELSHLLACILTLAKVKEVKLFSFKGGYVRHQKPKIPIIGVPLISFFPVIGGALALIFIYKVIGFNLPQFSLSISFIRSFQSVFVVNWQNYIFWIAIYLSISIIMSITPSKKDMRNSLFALLILFVLITILIEMGVVQSLNFLNPIINVIAFSLTVGIFTMLFSGLIYLIKSGFVKVMSKL